MASGQVLGILSDQCGFWTNQGENIVGLYSKKFTKIQNAISNVNNLLAVSVMHYAIIPEMIKRTTL